MQEGRAQMKLTVNSRELKDFLPDDATLGQALAMVQEQKLSENEVLAGIWVDGEPLTAERLSIWKDRSVEEFCEAAVEAPVRTTFAARGLLLIAERLEQSTAQREQIVDHITQGRANEGFTGLDEYLGIWAAVQQSLASVARLLELDFATLEYFPDESDPESTQPILELIEQLTEQLREVRSALTAGDMILLGDILDYEFPDLTANWTNMLNQLAHHIDPQN